MAKLPILSIPDPILRQIAKPVAVIDDAVRRLADDMLETMYAAPGIGLAAPQVGVSSRLIVLDLADIDDDDDTARPHRASQHSSGRRSSIPLVLINPEIVGLSSEIRSYEEGCLSIVDVKVEIERPASLTVRFLDRDGKRQQIDAKGLLATAIQHEIDHLDGRLIIDYLTRLKRDIIIRRFRKQAKSEETA